MTNKLIQNTNKFVAWLKFTMKSFTKKTFCCLCVPFSSSDPISSFSAFPLCPSFFRTSSTVLSPRTSCTTIAKKTKIYKIQRKFRKLRLFWGIWKKVSKWVKSLVTKYWLRKQFLFWLQKVCNCFTIGIWTYFSLKAFSFIPNSTPKHKIISKTNNFLKKSKITPIWVLTIF